MSTTPQPVPQTPESSPAATPVSNKRPTPSGVIPKQLQSWVYLGIIGVVAVGVWFSGAGKTPKPKNTSANGSASVGQARPAIGGLTPDEVQRRLDESEAARRYTATNLPPNKPEQPTDAHVNPERPVSGFSQPDQTPVPARDPIEEDERKREYVGRFASNVALSYRADPRAGSSTNRLSMTAPANVVDPGDGATSPLGLPSLPANFQQQLEALQAQQEKLLTQQQQLAGAAAVPSTAPQPQSTQSAPATARKNVNLNAATGKQHVIFEGTILESVLVNRLNGDFAGPIICQITNDLYSHDHSQLLIPAGTRVLGETKKVSDVGQERLAVIFHRLIMPDGYTVDLDQAPGLNQIGETALHDKVNNHYFKIFGASIAVGAIAGLATIGTNNSAVTGLPTSNASAYREGVAGSLSQSSLRILDRFLNIPPTITIREGHRVRIFLTEDLMLPAYAQHKMPSDL